MTNTRRLFPLVLIGTGALLIVITALVLWGGPAESPAAMVATSAPPAQGPYPEVPRVRLADAQAALEAGEAVFLDVRSAAAYADGHLPGAILIPLNELAGRQAELDPAAWIIPYCT